MNLKKHKYWYHTNERGWHEEHTILIHRILIIYIGLNLIKTKLQNIRKIHENNKYIYLYSYLYNKISKLYDRKIEVIFMRSAHCKQFENIRCV